MHLFEITILDFRSLEELAFVIHLCRSSCLVQFSPPAIKVQSVARLMSFKDKSAEKLTFVLGNVIIFSVFSAGLLPAFDPAILTTLYCTNYFKVCQ